MSITALLQAAEFLERAERLTALNAEHREAVALAAARNLEQLVAAARGPSRENDALAAKAASLGLCYAPRPPSLPHHQLPDPEAPLLKRARAETPPALCGSSPPTQPLPAQPNAPPPRRLPSCSARVAHNALEKTRRAQLRSCLDRLKSLVPLSSDSNRHTTLSLLTRAKAYIAELERDNSEAQARKVQLAATAGLLQNHLDLLSGGRREEARPDSAASSASTVSAPDDRKEEPPAEPIQPTKVLAPAVKAMGAVGNPMETSKPMETMTMQSMETLKTLEMSKALEMGNWQPPAAAPATPLFHSNLPFQPFLYGQSAAPHAVVSPINLAQVPSASSTGTITTTAMTASRGPL